MGQARLPADDGGQGVPLMEGMSRDLRYAWRALRRTPTFTAVAVGTLALGIGANTAIFSVVNSVLLTPLPYQDPDRLVRVMMEALPPPTGGPARRSPVAVTAGERDILAARTRTLAQVGAAAPTFSNWTGHEPRLQGAYVSASVFPILGINPLRGRVIETGDEAPGANPVIVLSEGLWEQAFARAEDVIGRTMVLENVLGPPVRTTYTIIGVMPDALEFPSRSTRYWTRFPIPVGAGAPAPRGFLVARLAENVSIDAAAADVIPILRELQKPGQATTYELLREQDTIVGPVKTALVVLTGAVAFVFLIACVNVANLLLVRNAARRREMAIRTSLGAGRGQVIRLTLVESFLLALLGGIGGVILALGGIRLLRMLATTVYRFDLGVQGPPAGLPRIEAVNIDTSVLLFTTAVSLISALIFGLGPALSQVGSNPADMLATGAGRRRERLRALTGLDTRSFLVIAEIASTMVLLVGGGLMINSFVRLARVDPGYNASNVLTFQVSLPREQYSPARERAFADELTSRLRAVPGVEAATYAKQLPTVALKDAMPLARTPDAQRPMTPGGPDIRLVSLDYLKAMEIDVVAGRGLIEQDDAGHPPVLLVNEILARTHFAGNAVGQTVYVGRDLRRWQVVGVIRDVRQSGLDRDPEPQIFIDVRQWGDTVPLFPLGAYYAVRVSGDSSALVTRAAQIARQLEPNSLLFNVAPMTQLVSTTIVRPRMYATLLAVFAGMGMLLAVIGIYGVVAYSVTQRTREIGIRIALGAQRQEVLLLILRQSALLAGAGIAIGLFGAVWTSRYLEGMLFGIRPLDWATFAAASLLFAAIAGLASYVPARAAMTVNPVIALRQE